MQRFDRTPQLSWLWLLTLIAASWAIPATAQVVPDTTLGRGNNTITITNGDRTDILGGLRRNSSLFQSFERFSIDTNQQVYFANPSGIRNIFSRVTGGSLSNINGLLGVAGSANLFFMNPNGIIFGPNARLDVSGSFLATTANALEFADNQKFAATGDRAVPLVEVNIPIGLQIGTDSPAMLTNRGNLTAGKDLTLAAGNLDLQGQVQAGGNLTLQAQNTVKIRDTVNEPFVAQAGKKLLIQGNQQVDIFALNHLNSGLFSGGDTVLRSTNNIVGDAHYWAGTNFRVEHLDGTPGNLFSPHDPIIRTSGDVTFASYTGTSLQILAGGSVTVTGAINITGPDPTISTIPTLDIRAGTTAFATEGIFPDPIPGITGLQPLSPLNTPSPSGTANITIGSITNTSGVTSGQGQVLLTNQSSPNTLPGRIQTGSISVYGDVTIDSRGAIQTTGKIDTTISDVTTGTRTAGAINLKANGTITTGGDLLSQINGTNNGIAGNIILDAAQDINVNNQINSTSNNSASTYSNIFITSRQGSVFVNGATLSTTNKPGTAGNIEINAPVQVSITNGSSLASEGKDGYLFIGKVSVFNPLYNETTPLGSFPSPGNVTIDKSTLVATNDATGVSAGPSGWIQIAARNNATPNGNKINISNSSLQTTASGNADGGHVDLTVAPGGTIKLDRSSINSDLSGTGSPNAEGVKVNALNGTVTLDNNSRIITSTNSTTSSTIGSPIIITAQTASLKNTSLLNASTNGAAAGGNISIQNGTQNANSVEISGSSLVTADALSNASNNGGNITISSDTFTLSQGGRVQARTLGQGNAGSVQLTFTNTATISGLDNNAYSGILTDTQGVGEGGKITINQPTQQVGTLTLSDGGFLSARTTGAAQGGSVEVNINTLDLLNGGQIITTSSGSGKAGNIAVNAVGNVSISGNRPPLADPISPFSFLPDANNNLFNLDNIFSDTNPDTTNIQTVGIGRYLSSQRTATGFSVSPTTAANNAFDYYSFSVQQPGSLGIFDIDFGNESNVPPTNIPPPKLSTQNIDTQIFLFDRATGRLLANNDDAPLGLGNSGSRSTFDSYLSYNFNDAGTYVLGVARCCTSTTNGSLLTRLTSTPVQTGQTYTLQVSLQNQGPPPKTGLLVERNSNQGFNSGLFAQNTAQNTGRGAAGNITVSGSGTTALNLSQGAQILASTVSGISDGITLKGLRTLQISDGKVVASTQIGKAGNVDVNASGNIDLTNGSRIAVEAGGANGVAGNVKVTGANISLSGGASRSAISTSATGANANAGDVTLSAIGQSLTLQNSDIIASSASGTSGNVSITARQVDLKNGTIKAETGQNTPGRKTGSITLDASFRLTLEDESEISTLGRKRANGGDITIKNVRFLLGKPPTGLKGSDIVGRADDGGQGGKVVLERSTLVKGFRFGKAVLGNRTNDIDTNGQLDNFSTDADVGTRGLSTPPIAFTDVSQLTASACDSVGAKATASSELRLTGRGGVTLSPTAPLPALPTASDWVSLDLTPQVPTTVTFANGEAVTLQPGQTYQIHATCVKSWKAQQRSLL